MKDGGRNSDADKSKKTKRQRIRKRTVGIKIIIKKPEQFYSSWKKGINAGIKILY